jgi:hypothetical protein
LLQETNNPENGAHDLSCRKSRQVAWVVAGKPMGAG